MIGGETYLMMQLVGQEQGWTTGGGGALLCLQQDPEMPRGDRQGKVQMTRFLQQDLKQAHSGHQDKHQTTRFL